MLISATQLTNYFTRFSHRYGENMGEEVGMGRRQSVCSSVLSTISSQVTELQGPVGGLCKALGTMEGYGQGTEAGLSPPGWRMTRMASVVRQQGLQGTCLQKSVLHLGICHPALSLLHVPGQEVAEHQVH